MKFLSFLMPVIMLATISCGRSNTGVSSSDTSPIELNYARLLKIDKGNGYDVVRVINPWDSTKLLHTYVLVSDSVSDSVELPEGTVIRVPIKRAVVYSTIHTDLLDELGRHNLIKGVTDVNYITSVSTLSGIKTGEIVDCGHHLSPSVEKIIKLNADCVLLSPYEGSADYGQLGQAGIPLVECADYMENTPLGRAEWMKLFGLLTGKYDEACRLFETEVNRYDSLRQLVDSVSFRPKVLMDMMYGNTWYVPRRDATISRYIHDAGGENPFDYLSGTGSSALNAEKVVYIGGDSDIWLIRYSQSHPLTLETLTKETELYGAIQAKNKGGVWGANLAEGDYFTASAFHPSIFLDDFIRVLHPEVADSLAPRYFKRLW